MTAVWALLNYGFRAVIAPRYGDIFRENSLLNGLLTVEVPAEVADRLLDAVEADPAVPVTVDLWELEVRCADLVQPFRLDDRARDRMLSGMDTIAMTLGHADEITAYERARRPTLPVTR